jgi:cell division protein FtsL
VDFADLIPVVAILASVAMAAMAVRLYELRIESKRMEREAGVQAEEKRKLELRLAVLERLATDRGMETAEQIEALRDRA